MSRTILIAGASVRCAVDSAIRGGYTPLAADLFADYDLRQQCQSYRIHDYPAQLLDISRELPDVPWMYTGGLENHPRLVDQISRHHPLMGNSGSVLRKAYNPFLIQELLADQGLPYPEITRSFPETTAGKWLRKSFQSTGGQGISRVPLRATSIASENSASSKKLYYQRFLDGPCYSATFLASDHTCDLLGVTRQLVGKRFANGPSFGYCGSIGPIVLTLEQKLILDRIGRSLTTTIPLRGLFGIDFIWHASQIWTLEINPRFPASVEILELASGFSATALHCQAFLDPKNLSIPPMKAKLQYGKAIIYSREACTITSDNSQHWAEQDVSKRTTNGDPSSWFADIPMPGTTISMGGPILTVVAQDRNSQQVLQRLIRTARQVRQECQLPCLSDAIDSTGHREQFEETLPINLPDG